MSVVISGLGTAVPSTTIDQNQALEIARVLCSRTPEQESWLPGMFAKTGIHKRHFVHPQALIDDLLAGTRDSGSPYLPTGEPDDRGPSTGVRMRIYAEEAPRLALTAAREALADSGVDPATVTHLVTVSCTGFCAPGLDYALMKGLELPPGVERTHVGFMGCHGALNGLRVASALAAQDPNARVLLCAVELCSLHYQFGWNPQQIIANALFADGAGAVILEPARGADRTDWRLTATGSSLIAGSPKAMTWSIGDHGFEMTLSKKVPDFILGSLRAWLEEWLGGRGLSIGDVGSWAVHPGGPKILDAVGEALALEPSLLEESREVFAKYGNMSSPTVLFILRRLIDRGAARPCVALGFGPGLVVEGTLIR